MHTTKTRLTPAKGPIVYYYRAIMNKKILIIERNIESVNYYSNLLNDIGYEVNILTTDIQLLRRDFSTPDLFIINSHFLTLNAIDICRHLKGDGQTAEVPVIILSGIAELKNAALQCGAIAFLEKPVVSAKLLSVIEGCLGGPER